MRPLLLALVVLTTLCLVLNAATLSVVLTQHQPSAQVLGLRSATPLSAPFYQGEAESLVRLGRASVLSDSGASGSRAVVAWANGDGVRGSATFPASETGTYTVSVRAREDAYKGNAHFSLYLDGQVVGGSYVSSVLGYQIYSAKVSTTTGTHSFKVVFNNDAYGGSSATDRNLYLDTIAIWASAPSAVATPPAVPPTSSPAPSASPTTNPPATAPPTAVPPTTVPSTVVPPTSVPPTAVPPTVAPSATPVPAPTSPSSTTGLPPIKTVFLVVMENHNWNSIKGSSSAPYINNTLLPQASYATQYYNPPGLHPSLGNYLWMESGGCASYCGTDNGPGAGISGVAHLTGLLGTAGVSWRSYEEGISGTDCPISDRYPYAVRHDPVVYFNDVTGNQSSSYAPCITHVRPYTQLPSDLSGNTAARYNFITPNLCNDGHDSCSPLNDAIKQTDTWLQNNVPAILNSATYKDGGALFITWDEGEGGSDGPIGFIALSPYAKGQGYAGAIHYTHGSLLRTLEEVYGVSPLLGGAQNATDLRDLFTTTTSPPPAAPTPTPAPVPQAQPTSVPSGAPTAVLGAGPTYYVDCSGGSDSNAGTSTGTAWQSLAKANAASLGPGSNLLLKRGCTWTGLLSLGHSGTQAAPILVGAYGSGSLPVIQSNQGGQVVVSLPGSYITVDSLAAHALPPATDPGCNNNPKGWMEGFAFRSGATYDVVQNSEATGGWAGADVQSGASHDQIVYDRLVDNIMMWPLSSGGNDDAGAFGVTLHGDWSLVAHNTISGSSACSYDYTTDGSAVEIYGGQNNVIQDNVAVNDDAFTELGNSRSLNTTYAYNLYQSSLPKSIFLNTRGASDSLGPVNGTKAYNNTVYLTGSSSQGFVCGGGCNATVLTMRNNIMQAAWKAGYADATFDEDHDLFWGGQRQFTVGAHSKVADPLFVAPTTGNLHIQSGSPALGLGVPLGYASDLDGRAVGSVPDAGAYQGGALGVTHGHGHGKGHGQENAHKKRK